MWLKVVTEFFEMDLRMHCICRGQGRIGLCWFLLAACLLFVDGPRDACAQGVAGLQVPDGFEATLFADDDLAHDIYCLTIDSLGRVAVSGQGYVKLLIDADGDGVAESAKTFAEGPQTGAQGMYFHGRDLLCIGDEGLLRYRDRDADDQADGPPDVFLKLKAGSEHHTHAIRKGPDGWWYIMAGNDAGIDKRYATLPTSPIKDPQSGVFFRLKPDLSGAELIADGFRNAYDFAFNSSGDAFTYDSDDERDISLPWYRPTRVFHILPGWHAGWLTRSWKHPDYFADMPPVMAALGRGSPTGVVCYQHTQFPPPYRDSLFVLDWTYGRVLNVKLAHDLASYHSEASPFITGTGGFGFAPTDVEVAPDGSLYITVGGRGTRGGIYRIVAKNRQAETWPADVSTEKAKLSACLSAPQPLSSWSRRTWEPLARSLGKDAFVAAAHDSDTAIAARIRAIEIVTELFGGFEESHLARMQLDSSPLIRARAVWSFQRTHDVASRLELLVKFLGDSHPYVGRIASEALLGLQRQFESDVLADGLVTRLKSRSPFDRLTAARLVPLLSPESFKRLSLAISKAGYEAGIANAFGYLGRKSGVNLYAFRLGTLTLQKSDSNSQKLEALRLMQLGLGDLVPQGKLPPAFDGYAPRLDLAEFERELDPFRIELADRFPTGDERLDIELSRLLAMLQPYNPELLTRVLAKITDETNPTDDIHYLLVAARIPTTREARHTAAISRALVNIEVKLQTRNMPQDSNWDDRLGELYKSLVEQDSDLPAAIVQDSNFGSPGHVLFMSQFPPEAVEPAISAFARQIATQKDYPWSNDVVFVLGESKQAEHRELLRAQTENFAIRGALLQVLAAEPEERDRPLFVAGLESPQPEVLDASVAALEKLPKSDDVRELIELLRCIRRLGSDKNEYAVRERVVRLLQRATEKEFPFEFGPSGYEPQTQAIEQWTRWVSEKHPTEFAAAMGADHNDLNALKSLLMQVNWDAGDASHGRRLFEARSCAQCHGSRKALGPDLAGVTGRFSREDLFVAIVMPNRDVSPRYQTTMIETKDGRVFAGLIVYESVDGLLLRNSTNQTFRIETRDIELRRRLPQSLMPNGLLKGLQPGELADLYAYLKTQQLPVAKRD